MNRIISLSSVARQFINPIKIGITITFTFKAVQKKNLLCVTAFHILFRIIYTKKSIE